MDRQKSEISSLELTTEELDDVSGGVKNQDTAAFNAFLVGMVKGFQDAGGNLTLAFGRVAIQDHDDSESKRSPSFAEERMWHRS